MATSGNKLGKNIKDIRKAHGETQAELGIAINVEDNTISMYESGRRQPDIQTVQSIASHYGFTLDRLVREDFSKLDLTKSVFTWENVVSLVDVMFPIAHSDKSLEDIYFAKGYEYTQNIVTKLKKGGNIMRSTFEIALDEYSKSLDASETIEAAANILWLVYVLYSLLPDKHSEAMGKALYYGKATGKEFIKKYALKNEGNENEDTANNKLAYARDMNEYVVGCMQMLKSSTDYSDFADYYMALRYIIGMVDTEYGTELNSTIGMEMMLSCLSIGNPYAFAFVEKSLKL